MNINPHEATVTTATVEIRCLTVNGKQVTLAVFRQLTKEDWDGVGQLWGQVNYHPDKACSKPLSYGGHGLEHLHVVWQKGDQLRRTVFSRAHYRVNVHESVKDEDGHWMTTEEKLAWKTELEERWERLIALPQLFIAV